MALITRLSRLFKADFHAVIDHLEEPDIVLKQAVREMEDAVVQGDQSIAQMTKKREGLQQTLTEITRGLLKIEEELDICFASDKEELAKTLIKRKLEAERQHNQLATQQERLDKTLHETKAEQAERQSILESMQQKAAILTDSINKSRVTYPPAVEVQISDADIEIAFLKELSRRAAS